MPAPYALPELIAARLESQSIGIPIAYAVDLPSIVENSQIAPVVNIVPAGIRLLSDSFSSQRETVSVTESVYVVICTRYVNQLSGQNSRQLAGSYLIAVTTALLNLKLPGYSVLEFATPPTPQFIAGFGYYPLQFNATYEIS
jgi:hypothetical protein